VTEPRLGLDADAYARVVRETGSVIHCAASLNRKSEKSCLNVNLRGTLEVVQLARRAHDDHGLARFSHVSTTAVAGARRDETVLEDAAIDWERPDYDPYARTKKFCEHMVRQILSDVPRTFFRPSVVLGDSRRGAVTQFDMVSAFAFLARLPVLPLRARARIDIVPVDYVAEAVATIHRKAAPAHEIYHLSSGEASESYRAIAGTVARARGKRGPWFWPWLEAPFRGTVKLVSRWARGTAAGKAASRLEVFLPYLTMNTVFDNSRVAAELGRPPPPFTSYAPALLAFALEHGFRYPYRDMPR
jgi:nucleoside-diphosphate-sugar epimerase